MPALLEWGYGVIGALQAYRSPFHDSLSFLLSFLGDEFFYLLLIPGMYWLGSRRFALRFGVLLLVSVWLNDALKFLAAQPRPDVTRVDVLGDLATGGFPSGHAQNAVVTWGLVAWTWRTPGIWIGMALLMLGIGVSRVYLGVHFPHDVLAGWIIGLALLYLAVRMAPQLEAAGDRWPTRTRILVGLAATALLVTVFHGETALRAAGALAGISIGAPLEWSRVRFAVPQGRQRRVWAFVVGSIIALGIWFGSRAVFFPLGEAGVFLRYAAVGVWVTLGAPWLFVQARLARRREPGSADGWWGGEAS